MSVKAVANEEQTVVTYKSYADYVVASNLHMISKLIPSSKHITCHELRKSLPVECEAPIPLSLYVLVSFVAMQLKTIAYESGGIGLEDD